MREELIPLFPLPLVLFPRTPLPLHIFEERYKEMIADTLNDDSEFGVILTREGGIVNMGCTAHVDRVVHRYPDGRLDIVSTGRRRFQVRELVDGKSYLRANVTFFDDEDIADVSQDLRSKAIDAFSAIRESTQPEQAPAPELSDPQLSFQLAQIVDDHDFRQQLLTLRSETDRLRTLIQFFPVYIARWRHAEQVRHVAPRNGHGKIVPPLS